MGEPTIYVELDQAKFQAAVRELAETPGGIERAITRAVNDVAEMARTQVVRYVTGEINLPAGQVRTRNTKLARARRGQSEAMVNVMGYRVPITPKHFGARKGRRGGTYQIRRGGGRTFVPGSFLQTMPKTGHRGLFKRRGQPRLPIAALRGPSVPHVLEGVQEFAGGAFEQLMSEKLQERFDAHVGLMLEKKG